MRSRGYAFVLSILAFLSFSWKVEGVFNSTDFDRKLIALYKVVRYMYERPQQMNIGTVYGITLTEVSLAAALLHENARYLDRRYSLVFNELLELSYLTRQYILKFIASTDGNMNIQMKRIMSSPEIWIRPISWKRFLDSKRLFSTPGFRPKDTSHLTMKGEPKEYESDYCLLKIVQNKFKSECSIPDICTEIITKDDKPSGYPLTHRLLIIQTAIAMGCKEDETVPFSKLIPKYCSYILQDTINFESINFPYNARDLLIEEVVLCGLEGYLEFTDEHYEELILSWQHPSGCFSAFGFCETCDSYVRRTNIDTDFGCDSHATGLAAAALALLIRENVENIFKDVFK